MRSTRAVAMRVARDSYSIFAVGAWIGVANRPHWNFFTLGEHRAGFSIDGSGCDRCDAMAPPGEVIGQIFRHLGGCDHIGVKGLIQEHHVHWILGKSLRHGLIAEVGCRTYGSQRVCIDRPEPPLCEVLLQTARAFILSARSILNTQVTLGKDSIEGEAFFVYVLAGTFQSIDRCDHAEYICPALAQYLHGFECLSTGCGDILY
jgi:hypothetical protein